MIVSTKSKENTDWKDDDEDNPHMIALYYCYTPRPLGDTKEHVTFQQKTCEDLELKGRVRVSNEGINGVLSGKKKDLEEYERSLRGELTRCCSILESMEQDNHTLGGRHYGEELDIKYCHLREDIPMESQLFESLSVKSTKEVISLVGQPLDPSAKLKRSKRRKHPGSTKELKAKTVESKHSSNSDGQSTSAESENNSKESAIALEQIMYHQYTPAEHLSPEKWNERLLSSTTVESRNTNDENLEDAVLIDARNVYESRLGHFKIPGIPTILTNTRKYSSLPSVLDASIPHMAGKNVFMYCTGGVRCERASMYLQALAQTDRWDGYEKPKAIYQLEGGIQRYLERYGSNNKNDITTSTHTSDNMQQELDPEKEIQQELKPIQQEEKCLFKGRNFVFDPRRTDPVMGPDSPARCIMCDCPHHDYDNGYAPSDNKEARCCRCRILVLICNKCRSSVRVWGEDPPPNMSELEDPSKIKPDLFCGPLGESCVDEGNSIQDVVVLLDH